MWYRDPKFCPMTSGPALEGNDVRVPVAPAGVPGLPVPAEGVGVDSRVSLGSPNSGVGAAGTVSAESFEPPGFGVRTLAATEGSFELDRAPHTGQRPPSAGAELPHWGQFMSVL
jgi:hypothetical protein